jgi:hypothetical protein
MQLADAEEVTGHGFVRTATCAHPTARSPSLTYSLPTTHPARVIVVTGAQGGVDAGPTRVDDLFGGQSAQRDPTR